MNAEEILEQARAAGAKYLYYVDKHVVIGTPETVLPTAVPQNVICMGVQQFTEFVQQLLAKDDYEREFEHACKELVMSHIDRMNDVCESDTAERIIQDFTEKFDPIFDTYMSKKFPTWYAQQKARDRRREQS